MALGSGMEKPIESMQQPQTFIQISHRDAMPTVSKLVAIQRSQRSNLVMMESAEKTIPETTFMFLRALVSKAQQKIRGTAEAQNRWNQLGRSAFERAVRP